MDATTGAGGAVANTRPAMQSLNVDVSMTSMNEQSLSGLQAADSASGKGKKDKKDKTLDPFANFRRTANDKRSEDLGEKRLLIDLQLCLSAALAIATMMGENLVVWYEGSTLLEDNGMVLPANDYQMWVFYFVAGSRALTACLTVYSICMIAQYYFLLLTFKRQEWGKDLLNANAGGDDSKGTVGNKSIFANINQAAAASGPVANANQNQYSFLRSTLFWKFLLEVGVHLLFPYPFVSLTLYNFLQMSMFLRLYLVARLLHTNSAAFKKRNRIRSFYEEFRKMNWKIGFNLTMKILFYEHSIGMVLCSTVLTLVLGAFCMFILERNKYDGAGGHPFSTYPDCLWFTFVTFTTIGYGDMYPRTASARLVTVFIGVIGQIILAVFGGVVTNKLAPSKQQQLIVSYLKTETGQEGYENAAASLIQNVWRAYWRKRTMARNRIHIHAANREAATAFSRHKRNQVYAAVKKFKTRRARLVDAQLQASDRVVDSKLDRLTEQVEHLTLLVHQILVAQAAAPPAGGAASGEGGGRSSSLVDDTADLVPADRLTSFSSSRRRSAGDNLFAPSMYKGALGASGHNGLNALDRLRRAPWSARAIRSDFGSTGSPSGGRQWSAGPTLAPTPRSNDCGAPGFDIPQDFQAFQEQSMDSASSSQPSETALPADETIAVLSPDLTAAGLRSSLKGAPLVNDADGDSGERIKQRRKSRVHRTSFKMGEGPNYEIITPGGGQEEAPLATPQRIQSPQAKAGVVRRAPAMLESTQGTGAGGGPAAGESPHSDSARGLHQPLLPLHDSGELLLATPPGSPSSSAQHPLLGGLAGNGGSGGCPGQGGVGGSRRKVSGQPLLPLQPSPRAGSPPPGIKLLGKTQKQQQQQSTLPQLKTDASGDSPMFTTLGSLASSSRPVGSPLSSVHPASPDTDAAPARGFPIPLQTYTGSPRFAGKGPSASPGAPPGPSFGKPSSAAGTKQPLAHVLRSPLKVRQGSQSSLSPSLLQQTQGGGSAGPLPAPQLQQLQPQQGQGQGAAQQVTQGKDPKLRFHSL